jgi:SAM-dependent MidA family methyltransferase
MQVLDLPAPDAEALAHSAHLIALLRATIAAHGPLSFSAYMERVLYAPGLGYYSAGSRKFGAHGDFVTSAELGPVFARCVASALAPSLQVLGSGADWLELGGGSGAFAEHVLLALAARDALPACYRMLEPSAELRERQQARLRERLPEALFARMQWIDRPPETSWRGVLFANEVIDALPATRFTLRDGEVFEEYVALDGAGAFVRQDRPADALTAQAVRHLEHRLGRPFDDGYRSELLPQLPYWMQAVAGTLQQGLALFVDYGYPRAEYYLPQRHGGTLRAFYRQRVHEDVFFHPGLQDLTASVDFSALAEAGAAAGLDLAAYVPQGRFLQAAGIAQAHAEAAAGQDDAGIYALAQEIKRLMLPEAMGERFQAMLFTRGMAAAPLPAELLLADRRARL